MDININITLKNIDIKFSEKEDCLESAYRQIEDLIDKKEIDSVAAIVNDTRKELNSEMPRISTHISTRSSVEMVSLIYDGFELSEAAEVCIYPQYSNDGGVESERTYVKQLVQKYVNDGSDDNLFNDEEIENANGDMS